MTKNKHVLSIFLISLMVSSVFLHVSISSSPGSNPRVYINPSSVFDKNLVPGETFTVDVKIDDVTELYAYEFKLNYDPEILSAIAIEPSFLNGPTFVGKKQMDNEAGSVWVAITSWYPAGPKTGSGILATITFEVKGKGDSVLDLYRTKLADYDINRVSHDVEDGYFSNQHKKPKLPKIPKVTLSGFMPIVNAQTCIDADIDTFNCTNEPECGPLDCDDNNQFIYPMNSNNYCDCDASDGFDQGTNEICDFIDNDCDDLIDEPDICCVGDVDHDINETNYYNVDIFDLAKIGKAYGSTPSDSRWNSYCDLNEDGVINIFDLAKVGKNYGNTCLACVTVTIHVQDSGSTPIEFAWVGIYDPGMALIEDAGLTDASGNVYPCLPSGTGYVAKVVPPAGGEYWSTAFNVPGNTYVKVEI